MENCFIDTNVFLRTIERSNQIQHQECVKVLQKIKEGVIIGYTADLVISEIVWTLNSFYSFDKSEIVEVVKGILSLNNLKILYRYDAAKAIDFYESYSVKFIDAQIASMYLVVTGKIAVVTYDQDFQKIPGILVKSPKVFG